MHPPRENCLSLTYIGYHISFRFASPGRKTLPHSPKTAENPNVRRFSRLSPFSGFFIFYKIIKNCKKAIDNQGLVWFNFSCFDV